MNYFIIMEPYIHNIIAPKPGGYILPVILTVLLFALPIAFIGILHSMKNTTINVSRGELTVKALFYGKKIPISEIDVSGVKRLDLLDVAGSDHRITLRTNGISLPGFRSGWMKLKNGRKALVFLTDMTNVVLIPTDNYDILFSTDDFEGLKRALGR